MPLLETLISGIGTAIATTLVKLWLKDQPLASAVGESVLSILGQKVSDVRKRNAVSRQLDAIGERAADSIRELLLKEAPDLAESRLEMVANAAAQTISHAPITADILAQNDLEPELLKNYFTSRTTGEGGNPGLASGGSFFSTRESEIYQRILGHASQLIVDIASQLPQFSERVLGEILRRETDLIERSERIINGLDRLLAAQKGENADDDAFETIYRSACIRRLDHLELFGVDLQQSNKRYKLSVAYVTLEVERIHGKEGTSAAQNSEVPKRNSMPVNEALFAYKRLLVRGPAGSGKTTLLQWTAVLSAGRDMTGELTTLNEAVPFFIRLRDYADAPLPNPDNFSRAISTALGGEPAGWAHRLLSSGQSIVLIDGLDEAAESRRDEIKKWLSDLINQYPSTRFIVTSRPHAACEGWLDPEGFVDASLQPMRRDDIYEFVSHWHQAVGEAISDPDDKFKIAKLAEILKQRLKDDGSLFRLSGSPLLCAIICALHRDRKEDLPKDRIELYRACVEMFFRRDRERKVSMEGYLELSDRQKHKLLQSFAWWLIKNGKSAASPEESDARFDAELSTLADRPEGSTGAEVRRLMIERVGILRQLAVSKVDFPHRTFQEYLAAHEVVADDDLGLLIQNAHADQWREVVILTAGILDSPQAAERFILGLLERGDNEISYRGALYTVAAAALDAVIRLPSKNDLREMAGQRLSVILPPSSISAAKELSAAGDLAVRYLKYRLNLGVRQAGAAIRALTMIGTESATEALCGYGDDSRVGVSTELLKALTDLREELSNILGRSILSISLSDLNGANRAPLKLCYNLKKIYVNWLPNEPNLQFLSYHPLLEQAHLTGASQLKSLSGAEKLTKLERLIIYFCDKLTDISALANLSSLNRLDFYGCNSLTNLVGIESLPSLQVLNLRDCVGLKNLNNIANLPTLYSIQLQNCKSLVDLSGTLLPKVRSVSFTSATELEDISGLSRMPILNNLSIYNAPKLVDANILGQLSRLHSLTLSHCSKLQDISFLSNLKELNSLYLSGCVSIENIDAIHNLKKLSHLHLVGCDKISEKSINAIGQSISGLTVLTTSRYYQF